MYEGHRVVVVTPAGRREYLELLIPQVLKLKPCVDEYRLWVNTNNQDDIAYMQNVANTHPDFIKLEYLPPCHHVNGNSSIRHFFQNAKDTNTVYVRFDDDIIAIDTLEAFQNFLKFRIDHPEYFLIVGTIMNNAIISNIQQRVGNIPLLSGKLSRYDCMESMGWNDPHFAEELHRYILSKPLKNFRLNTNWLLLEYERVSINCISWLGKEFAEFSGVVSSYDEEEWLTCVKPRYIQKPNCIYGGFVCVHYAFHIQREHLRKTDILDMYKKYISDSNMCL